MFSASKQNNFLYLITVLLLIMQSLAIWHDSSHSFHAEDSHCERFEAFANSPALDLIPVNLLITIAQTSIVETFQPVTLSQYRQRDAYAIRAPPALFS